MKRFCDLPSKEQEETKNLFFQLRFEGKGYKKIRRVLKEKEIKISLGTLSYWHNTATKRILKNSFEAKSSPELAYIIGVLFGDGGLTIQTANYDYQLVLETIDYDFNKKFSVCIEKILGKDKPYPIRKTKFNLFRTGIRCKELYNFIKDIKNDLVKGKPFIEMYPKEFIKGVADSEGHPSISATSNFSVKVIIANSANLELVQYIQDLLIRFFNVKSISRRTKRAGMQDSVIEGRIITRTKNVYLIETSDFADTCAYFNKVGFSIIRKQQKLEDAIFIKCNFKRANQIAEWKKSYKKVGKQWKRHQAPYPIL